MEAKVKVAINGFGRIGRAFFRLADNNPNIEVVAINDLGDKENLEYLLKHDSVYGRFEKGLGNTRFLQEKDPANLPWGVFDIDIVLESTGVFRSRDLAVKHLEAGAKRVVISAPSPDADTILIAVNEEDLGKSDISSNASCTTNATSPVVSVLNEEIGIEKALLNTIHSYTATQRTVDAPNRKDFRRGRAAALNMIPTSTGAAQATTKVHKDLADKFDGLAVRVPTPAGSLIDFTFISKRDTSVAEVNELLKNASESERWNGILAFSDEPLVLSDVVGRTEASIVDAAMTRVVGGNLVKVLAWYDNEIGYTNTLLKHVLSAAKYL